MAAVSAKGAAGLGAGLGGPAPLVDVVDAQKRGEARGVFSVCSANRFVLDAVLLEGRTADGAVLVETTSNQVNQEGGYSGLTPADFAASLRRQVEAVGVSPERVVFGGDHLGPHPWRREPAAAAMAKAAEMVRQYVQAGAVKIHLDASMPLGDDLPGPLDEAMAVERTAALCAAAERERPPGCRGAVYVIGTEVPAPGGERGEASPPRVTRPEDAARALGLTRAAFHARGLEAAWERVVGLVVQPGVDFGDERVFDYDPAPARPLAAFIESVPGIVYEAHSTDFQKEEALRGLVSDHFAILKVGPALTFAFREAAFALAAIEREWLGARKGVALSGLRDVVDEAMRRDPVHWQGYHEGDEPHMRVARLFSFSDRVRYYWARPEVQSALARLLANLEARAFPLTLLSQYLPGAYVAVREGRIAAHPRAIIRRRIGEVIELYARACAGPPARTPAAS